MTDQPRPNDPYSTYRVRTDGGDVPGGTPHSTFAPQIGDIITNLKNDGGRLVQDNIALAKAEVTPIAKKGGIGGGLFAGALYFILGALGILFMAGGFAFSQMWQSIFEQMGQLTALAIGYATMGLVLILIAAILGAIGYFGFIKKIEKPQATVDEVKATIATLQDSLKRGTQTVKVNALDKAGLEADKKALAEQAKRQEQLRKDANL